MLKDYLQCAQMFLGELVEMDSTSSSPVESWFKRASISFCERISPTGQTSDSYYPNFTSLMDMSYTTLESSHF